MNLDPPHSAVGRTVRLRPVLPQDVAYLYRLTTSADHHWRWRLRGRTPSPGDFEAFVWTASDLQFVIERKHDGQPCGHVCTYQTDDLAGTTKAAVITEERGGLRTWPIEGAFLFLDHLFTTFPYRKVYFEVPEFNLPMVGSFLDRYTVEEGRLREHTFADGAFCDVVVAAMWRSHWHGLQTSSLGRALSTDRSAPAPSA